MHRKLEPKLLSVLKVGYTFKQFQGDLMGGLTVGVVALPLAIALAIASGVKPEQGLYTAIVAGFIIALLGGSRVQVSGPTRAFVVIVYGIVQKYGYDGLVVATLIAGVLLVLMGLARMGSLLKFVPYPVIVGFTSGIALIIFSSQINDFLGLRIEKVPADFVEKSIVYAENLSRIDLYTVGVGAASLLIIALWPKITRKVPGQLIAILAATFAVQYFQLPVDTIQTRFGGMPTGLPTPQFPAVTWAIFQEMFSPAITIAISRRHCRVACHIFAHGFYRADRRNSGRHSACRVPVSAKDVKGSTRRCHYRHARRGRRIQKPRHVQDRISQTRRGLRGLRLAFLWRCQPVQGIDPCRREPPQGHHFANAARSDHRRERYSYTRRTCKRNARPRGHRRLFSSLAVSVSRNENDRFCRIGRSGQFCSGYFRGPGNSEKISE
jgi:hypothetical protein